MKRTLLAVALAGLTMNAHAVLNAGFESGNLNGWNTNLNGGSATVVLSSNNGYGINADYLPVEGSYFLAVGSGAANVWQTVTQAFTLGAGQSLSGSAAFDWGDYGGYSDGARIRVLDAIGTELATVFYMDGSGYPNGYSSPWTAWSWTAASAGTYSLEYAARNTADSGGPATSYGYFDAAEVPEPGTLALFGVALAGLAMSRRKAG